MPIKHQPDLMYLRQVPLNRIHIFTFIQLFCLAVLWAIKSTDAALIFPIMVCIILLFYSFTKLFPNFTITVTPPPKTEREWGMCITVQQTPCCLFPNSTILLEKIKAAFHLPKISGNFGWNENGKTCLAFPNGKCLVKTYGYLKCSPRKERHSICSLLQVPGLLACICPCGKRACTSLGNFYLGF